MNKVAILGTGAAGLTAAVYTARAGMDPLIVEGFQPGGQLTTTTDIENYPGFPEGISGPVLMADMRKQAERFGARLITGEVTGAELGGAPFKFMVNGQDEYSAETLIIATGASALYLGLESENKLKGRGVSGCATCDGAFFRDVPVCVIGGGDTAMEEALFLTRFASKVFIIHRRDQLRASKIMGERALANNKIEVVWDSVVEEVLDVSENKVTGVRLKNVKTGETSVLPVEGMFLGIGHKPNTDPFRGQLDMDEKGYILTHNTHTNIEGVFAAGDVQDPKYRQAITAAGTGCMAALEVGWHLEARGQ